MAEHEIVLDAKANVATPPVSVEIGTHTVKRLPVPGEPHWAISVRQGVEGVVVRQSELMNAPILTTKLTESWSSPDAAMQAFGLQLTFTRSVEILRELFGHTAEITPILSVNPESPSPTFVLQMCIPVENDELRDQFVDRYIREVPIPPTAPTPVLTWCVANAVHSG